jgi:hypothetical protein
MERKVFAMEHGAYTNIGDIAVDWKRVNLGRNR